MSLGSGHFHGIRYWEAGDMVLVGGKACDFYGVDAKTGKTKLWVKDLCLNLEGNLPKGDFIYRTSIDSIVATYDKGHQFVFVLPGYMHSSLRADGLGDARHTTLGISMDAPYNILWRLYSSPPKDRLVKAWAFEECGIGYFRDIPCKDAAAVNRAGLEWDFALPNQPPSRWGGVTANWGQPAVDEETGILYTATGNQGPYSNLTLAPGPRLYGSTIMAIDMNKGQRVWWQQPFPHDMYDYDCMHSGILLEHPQLGKVYVKGCKEGVDYILDAKTGKPDLMIDTTKDQLARGQISTLQNKYYAPDPKSFHDMREWNWISWPAAKPGEKGEHFTLPAPIYPGWNNGLFSSEQAYDPQAQRLILYETAEVRTVLKENPYIVGGELFITSNYPISNTTLVARDVATGAIKWTWFYPFSKQRAPPIVSGGMVIAGFTDGYVRFFDKDTGNLMREIAIGAPIVVGPSIGTDAAGNAKILVLAGSMRGTDIRYGTGPVVPGTLLSIGLSDKAEPSAKTTTVTTTATTTQSTTLTSTSATTVTTTAPGATVTTSVVQTETSGLPSEVTYAAIGVAMIAIAAAAVLVMRKK